MLNYVFTFLKYLHRFLLNMRSFVQSDLLQFSPLLICGYVEAIELCVHFAEFYPHRNPREHQRNISELLFYILVLIAMCRKPTVPRVNNQSSKVTSSHAPITKISSKGNLLSHIFVSHCLPQSTVTQDDTIICSHSV